MGFGMLAIPMFFPLLGMNYDISGGMMGLILCTPALTSIVAIPIINKFVGLFGIEFTIFTAGILYGLAYLVIGLTVLTTTSAAFLSISFICSIMIGFSTACNIVGEQALLLRYSIKSEREKNLGLFRSASGVGGLFSPLVCSGMYAWGGFMAVFMFIGAGYLLICPLIYCSLY